MERSRGREVREGREKRKCESSHGKRGVSLDKLGDSKAISI